MADLKGVKIRTQTSGVVADYWLKTGAIPTSVAWGELYQALQQKTVDASENAYPYFVQQNHHKTENGKYTTETGHDYTTRFLLMNGKKFDSLTDEQKQVLLDAAKASVDAERESLLAQEKEYKEKAVAEGAVINEIDRTPFIELAVPIQDEAAKDMGAEDLLKQIRDLK
jgi:TRAP-type C4-dicarboxylate transport system substrate-binding protein